MISHPNVVRVENFFRANETCYMVMQYVRGRTLQFHIQRPSPRVHRDRSSGACSRTS
jgi:serine/threonine protein kinase